MGRRRVEDLRDLLGREGGASIRVYRRRAVACARVRAEGRPAFYSARRAALVTVSGADGVGDGRPRGAGAAPGCGGRGRGRVQAGTYLLPMVERSHTRTRDTVTDTLRSVERRRRRSGSRVLVRYIDLMIVMCMHAARDSLYVFRIKLFASRRSKTYRLIKACPVHRSASVHRRRRSARATARDTTRDAISDAGSDFGPRPAAFLNTQ